MAYHRIPLKPIIGAKAPPPSDEWSAKLTEQQRDEIEAWVLAKVQQSSPHSTWSDPCLTRRVFQRWVAGQTSDAIAKAVGVTKNAIIGICHRMEVAGAPIYGRPSPIRPRDPNRERRTTTVRKSGIVASQVVRDLAPSVTLPAENGTPPPPTLKVPRLTAHQPDPPRAEPAGKCKMPMWPHGAKPNHLYCDKPTVRSGYCEDCYGRAYLRGTSFLEQMERARLRARDRAAA